MRILTRTRSNLNGWYVKIRPCKPGVLLRFGFKFEREGVYTVSFLGCCWSVVENMAQVGAAITADDFYPVGTHCVVVFVFDVLLVNRPVETGPTGVAMEFGIGIEKRCIANYAVIHTVIEDVGINA